MGMNIWRNLVGNLPQLSKAADTERTGFKPDEQTVKKLAPFPEKPGVQKVDYESWEDFMDAFNNGRITVDSVGVDTVVIDGVKLTYDGYNMNDNGSKPYIILTDPNNPDCSERHFF